MAMTNMDNEYTFLVLTVKVKEPMTTEEGDPMIFGPFKSEEAAEIFRKEYYNEGYDCQCLPLCHIEEDVR